MKILAFLILIICSTVLVGSDSQESKMNAIRKKLTTELGKNREKTLAILTQKLKTGTPEEKDAVLYVVEEKLVLELVPNVIDAITDTTIAPRYGDTGWSFIGRHASWAITHIVFKIDKDWLKQHGLEGKLHTVSFDKNREKEKAIWTDWWKQYQEKKEKPQQMKSSD